MPRYAAAAALIGLLAAGCPEPVPHVSGVEVAVAEAMFQSEVLDSPLPVLVDFGATWCGPCRQMEPVLAQLSLDYEGRLKVVKIDVDEAPSLKSKYNVSGIPALLVFVNGEEVDRTVGSQSLRNLARFIDPYVAAPAASAPVAEPAEFDAVSEPSAG